MWIISTCSVLTPFGTSVLALYANLIHRFLCFSLFWFNKQTTNLHTLMENKNQSTSSPSSPPPPPPSPPRSSTSSSFTAELFGNNDSQPSSAGVFSSIFPPPSTVLSFFVSRFDSYKSIFYLVFIRVIANFNSGLKLRVDSILQSWNELRFLFVSIWCYEIKLP